VVAAAGEAAAEEAAAAAAVGTLFRAEVPPFPNPSTPNADAWQSGRLAAAGTDRVFTARLLAAGVTSPRAPAALRNSAAHIIVVLHSI
jgi:hypothetical protein